MSDPEAELPAIIDLCAGAQLLDERGGKVAYLPAFTFDAGGTAITQNLLFVPAALASYPSSRLFYEHPVSGRGKNWTTHHLIGRLWHAPSYKVDISCSWREQILQHLQAVAQ